MTYCNVSYNPVHKKDKESYSPTNVILGVATIFLVTTELAELAPVRMDVTDLVRLVTAGCDAAAGLATAVVVVELAEEAATTTGSVEGIGLPSLVCSFKTCE